ncbi:MAG: sigma-70 family RNA polymerase sigma factor [Thermoanaerobaculia bacterium]
MNREDEGAPPIAPDDPRDPRDLNAPRDRSELSGLAESLEVTAVLQAWRQGDGRALERLLPLVYEELRTIAGWQLRRERSAHTLQPTALVNEAYLRLRNLKSIQWHDRAHFFAIAATIMRRVLVDHARSHLAAKRGAELARVTLTADFADEREGSSKALALVDLIDLDRALERLAVERPMLARLVEVRFFGGLSVEEAAEVLGRSPRTVKRDWAFARAWLLRELGFAGR